MVLKAGTNIIGPSGELVLKDQEIPEGWEGEFLRSLVEGEAVYDDKELEEEDEDGSE